ncbi:MAG TPA: redoxin family protein [Bryobacteraceae bacterium]|nr:redoxin family protein [Bryobacteraceae bacterium]
MKPDSDHPVLAIGSPAPDFSLPGVDDKTHTLAEYAGAKVLAIVFDCNHCPESHLYDDRIRKLYADYRDKGVQVVVVSPDNPDHLHYADLAYSDMTDSLIDMKERAEDTHIEYPFLYDGAAQSLTAKLGAVATPQIFVFDQARKLRYEGRIDDNEQAAQVKSQDARNAIDALLAGKEPAVTTTAVTGCPVIWNGKATPDPELAKANAEPVSVTMTTPEILKKLRGNGTGKLLLVNFWATWCGPCVAEYPDLQNTLRMYGGRNFGMTTVSEDVPEAKPDVMSFLKKNHATSVNYLFASDDTSSVQDSFDKNMSGAVPYTLLLAANGDLLYQEQGEISMSRMRRAILANLPDDQDHPGQQAYWQARHQADQ